MTEVVSTYSLRDLRCGSIRYVGATNRLLSRRLTSHVSDAKAGVLSRPLCAWLNAVASAGMRPLIVFEGICTTTSRNQKERALITRLLNEGHALLNAEGRGGRAPSTGKRRDGHRERSSEATREVWQREGYRERMRVVLAATKSEAARANARKQARAMGLAGKGKPKSPEHREKLAVSLAYQRASRQGRVVVVTIHRRSA